MLSLHTADVVEPGGGRPAVPGGAVLVDGSTIAAVGVLAELAAASPAARVRKWGGVLGPGREARGLDVPPGPAGGGARERGEAARRAAHELLRRGVTAVAGPLEDPVVRGAVARSGLVLGGAVPLAAGGRADFCVFAPDGTCVATVVAGRVLHRRV
ncbi:hypothetical protein SAMN05216267_1018106 [Actinacidiphila rubida]|uniref:Aminodeoxyfutalosine deaminase/Imidazolonepropionase-like composite domain-containing protein n=1 Tax=Actinacidiphila rubida TaxID=310780 RepID=A0A1H8MAK2_9ACTN|nr:hypothetical protein [Actinacidiphila rubida]SEO14375.1 hypothetical protein SAMN05216267_1018106 [Actinacidiphila rubida]